MTEREFTLLKMAIRARGFVLVILAMLIGGLAWMLVKELGSGADTNDALTTLLGGLSLGLTTAFGIIAAAFARDMTEFVVNARAATYQPDDK